MSHLPLPSTPLADAPRRTGTGAALLPRPRLQSLLLGRRYRLRLLCAPAGYGKSCLVRDCLGQSLGKAMRVTLDMAGRPVPLERLLAVVGRQLGLEAGQYADGASLRHALEALGEPLHLFLDDYPERGDADLDHWLDDLLCHSGAPLQLWVSSRRRPDWNLPRLFLDNELLELNEADLAFSRDEFESLASWLECGLGQAERAEAWAQTQGWCAGARLLLAPRTDNGAGTRLRDYLERELLARLDEDECQVLARLVHLPRFSTSLCAQLWDEPQSHAAMQRLMRSGAFFQHLDADGHWHRILPAVARALQGRIGQAELNGLRLKTCGMLVQPGFLDEAIDLALDAGQPEVAASYMDRLRPDWLLAGCNLHTLLGWRKRLPEELLRSTPGLIFLNACALLINYNLDEAQACLDHLQHLLPQPDAQANRYLLANWQALRGTLLAVQGHTEQAREYCRAALAQLAGPDWQVSYMCHSTLARVAIANGDAAQARQILNGAVEQMRRHACLAGEVMLNSERIAHMILCGENSLAEALLQESLQLLREDGDRHGMQHARLLVMQGKLQLQRGELAACERTLTHAWELTQEQVGPGFMHTLLGLSEVAAQRGDHQLAFRHLQDAERRMQRLNVNEYGYRGILQLHSLAILIHQRNWEQALPLARQLEDYLLGPTARLTALQSPSFLPRSQLLLAQAELGVGQLDAAHKRLRTLHRECQRLGFHGLLGKIERVMRQVAERAPESPPDGEARPQGRPQAFNLLLGSPATGERRIACHPTFHPGNTRRHEKALTLREISVLELLAEGLSNQEIGERLYISTNTVKTHTKHINHKLGVTRRTQAIVRARAIGVLA